MNWLDIIIIIALIIPTFIGFKRGLIKTVLPLGGIMLAIVLAGHFYGSMASWLSNWLESTSQANIAAFVLIFVLVMAVVFIVASVLHRFISLMLLGWVDKIGGLIFGLAIGAFICSALLALIVNFPFSGVGDTVRGSGLAAFFLDHFPFVLGLLPGEFESVRDFFN